MTDYPNITEDYSEMNEKGESVSPFSFDYIKSGVPQFKRGILLWKN